MNAMRYFQVSKSSSDFWNSLKLTWQQCSTLPMKCDVTSIAELDGKVYIAVADRLYPLVYDSHKNEWSSLRKLPYVEFSLVAVHSIKQLLAIGGVLDDVITNKVFVWDKDTRKWTTPYPDMPTARYLSSSISHGSAVIVAGGVTCCSHPWTMTGAVEVLHITEHRSWFSKSYNGQWSVVERLPHVTYEAIPLIVEDNLYIAEGYDNVGSICDIVAASLPELLQSGIKRTARGKVWRKLPDMPSCPWSITHYQGRLIIFNGDRKIPSAGKNKWELIKQSYLFNPSTNSWDYVGDDFHDYKLGRAVHLRENKIIFMGGITGTFMVNKEDDFIESCSMLTFTPK